MAWMRARSLRLACSDARAPPRSGAIEALPGEVDAMLRAVTPRWTLTRIHVLAVLLVLLLLVYRLWRWA